MTSNQVPSPLSVVIVSWNTRDLLERCLLSVSDDLRHAGTSAEIIVVDNGSSDGTVTLLRERFPDVSLIPLEGNLGFAAATNVGIRQSRGQTLLLLNPDTEVQRGAIAAMLIALHSMPHVGMVSGLLLNPDGSLQSSGYRFPGLAQTFFDFFPLHPRLVGSTLNGRVSAGDLATPYAVDHPLGACMLVTREVVERVGLLDESYFMYSEEIDWCRRIQASGWTILIAPSARIIHHGGQSTRLVPTEMFVQLHQSRARYFRQHHGSGFVSAVGLMARAAALRAGDRRDDRDAPASHDATTLRAVSQLYRQAATHGV